MPLWGLTGNQASNSAKFATTYLNIGSGSAAKTANQTSLFQNTSPEVWPNVRDNTGAANVHGTIGQFALVAKNLSNTSGEAGKAAGSSVGWMIRRAWEGGVVSFSVNATATTAAFANGETVTVSNGNINASGMCFANTSGNLVSIVVTGGGRFINSSILVQQFNHEKHLTALTPTAAGSSGFTNGDLVLCGNGIITGIGVITTNGSGNLASVAVNAAANGGFGAGLWANTTVAGGSNITFTFVNAAAITNANPWGTATIANSAGGGFSVNLGGRAGRVTYECLVEASSITSANSTFLPNT